MAISLADEEDEQQQQPKRIRASHSSVTSEDPLSVPTLLPEIIVEILSRLPVNSVLRCKSVCKLWYSMISDPHFVKSHLTLSTNNTLYAHHRLIYYTDLARVNLKSGLLYDVLNDGSINATELDCPLKNPSKSISIVGSCDGLVLLKEEDTLLIWNPSTRKSNRLPLPYCGLKVIFGCYVYGIGSDACTDDYKVAAVSCIYKKGSNYDTRVDIYSLKSGNWKKFGDFSQGIPLAGSGKFCNGALHWVARPDLGPSNSRTIVSLDLATETYGEILQPVYGEGDNFYIGLGSLGKWLCVVCNYCGVRADVWVMKDYGVKDSWTKLVSVPYVTEPEIFGYSVPLCITNDGKVLLQFEQKLVVYDSKNQSFSQIQDFDESSTAYTFVESLVSPT